MNQDELLQRLISTRPSETQVAEAAARARRRALARFADRPDAATRLRRWPVLAAAASLAACAVVLLWHTGEWKAPPPAATATVERAAEPPMKVVLTLADGTRVIWTIDKKLSL